MSVGIRITNLRMPVERPEHELLRLIAQRCGLPPESWETWRILRKALDARSPHHLEYVYTVLVYAREEHAAFRICSRKQGIDIFTPDPFDDPPPGEQPLSHPPVIVGTGPAGLLAGFYLALKGYQPLLIERGQPVKARVPRIRAFDSGAPHDPESNYLFGEGGAGCFSDGKLTCRCEGPDVEWVLHRFVDCGGRPALVYEQRPHLGSNKLPMICRNFRRRIEALGGVYRFGCRLLRLHFEAGKLRYLLTTQGKIPAEVAILATGHSARDIYEMLYELGIPLQPKPFQLGLRIEQPQAQIDQYKYGRDIYRQVLGAADYAIQCHTSRDVFTFCMCAGGIIIPSISEAGAFCTNGMSNSRHDSPFANSGIMVTLQPAEFGSNHPLAGVYLQRYHERIAYELGRKEYYVPAQDATDFLQQKGSTAKTIVCSYRRGSIAASLEQLLPPHVLHAIRKALPIMNRKLRGALLPQAVVVGPEMRGSAPVRIVRDAHTRTVPGFSGLYPVGEGAGYAGGIVSAAVDGLRSAREIVRRYRPLTTDLTSSA